MTKLNILLFLCNVGVNSQSSKREKNLNVFCFVFKNDLFQCVFEDVLNHIESKYKKQSLSFGT